MKTKALLVTAPDTLTVGEVEVPEPGPGEALVEAVYTGVSPGTEFRAMSGRQPGMPPFPFIPGYGLAGRVVRTGPDTKIPVGTPVSGANRCWGAHIAHAVRPERDLLPLPETVSLKDASLLRLAAIAYHGVRLSHAQPHETVAVVGLGPIGQLSARLHAVTGARVLATDLSEDRCALARAFDVTAIPAGNDMISAVRAYLPDGQDGADVVVDATGSPAVLATSVQLARSLPWDDSPASGARFLVQGSYPADVPVPYQEVFQRELTLLFPRSDQPRDLHAVLDLMCRERLIISDLISAETTPEQASAAYRTLQDPASGWLTMAVRWR
jgi:2-desacetyl-2-hydroxyethyl bacteriochlorophyllide A dehydrogenase